MSIPRQTSLVTSATLWILVVVLLVGAVSLWWGNALAIERETTRTQNQLRELLDTVERPASIACFLQDRQLANEVSQGLLSNQIVKRIVIRAGATLLAEAVRPTDAGGVQPVIDGNPAHVIHRPLLSPFNPDETVGEILLAPDPVALENRVAQASYFIAILLMVQIVAVGVTVVLAIYGLITRPLRQISDRLRDLPAEQGVKLTHSAGHESDEIGRVVNYINHLLN
ncbi:MAG: Diguanylate cyclase, partial [Pseudomonadota bacterium]|nr:Diguanylate cyclase [Pseudomonadota bacterium]